MVEYDFEGIFTIERDPSSSSCVLVFYPDDMSGRYVDYCNRWGDIGPIIERDNICLQSPVMNSEWYACDIEDLTLSEHKNPKRAAAICYLMMKDLENDQES